jgi:hypothetical protein
MHDGSEHESEAYPSGSGHWIVCQWDDLYDYYVINGSVYTYYVGREWLGCNEY